MKQRSLTDAECEELQNLKNAVYRAEYARDEWLRNKGKEIAALREGDEIWDLETSRCIGKVTGVDVSVGEYNPLVNYWYRFGYETCSTKGLKCPIGTREQVLLNLREKLKGLEEP